MRHDSFTCVNDLSMCVTLLIHMWARPVHVCDMTHSHVWTTCPCVWHDSFTCVNDLSMCDTWLIHMCARLVNVCDMTHSHALNDSCIQTTGTNLGVEKEKEGKKRKKKEEKNLFTVEIREEFWGQDWRRLYMRQGQIIETWLIRARHVTHSCEIDMGHHSFPWDMTGIWDMTHAYGTWLIHMGHDSFPWNMNHESFVWDMTHSCETWLIHMGHDSFIWDISMGHDSFTHFSWDMTEDEVS